MSGATTATFLVGSAIAASAYMSYAGGKAQLQGQKAIAEQNKTAALKQEKSADEANNRANQKSPNTAAIMDAATQSGRGGASSTLLTGASGVDPNALQLGKTSLLGM